MENKKPEFAFQEHSVTSVATQLHAYFRDLQSYYKIAQGEILSHIDATEDQAKAQKLKQQLREINEKVQYFHVLTNSLSTVDIIMHTELMIAEFRSEQETD